MTVPEEKKAGYITLKEASERFGYSPDYIGQLIRKGKISGKQVYMNVAWMTTPEAMEEYLLKEKKKKSSDGVVQDTLEERSIVDRTLEHVDFDRRIEMFRFILRGIIVVLTCFVIFIMHIVLTAVPHTPIGHSGNIHDLRASLSALIANHDTP